VGAGALVATHALSPQHEVHSVDSTSTSDKQHRDGELPTIRKSEVAKHTSAEAGGIWVTYEDGVYDVTEFVSMHPGGNKILLAAGSSIAPYWGMYAVHKTAETRELLEEYRIGNLPEDEVEETGTTDVYANEPERDPSLIIRTETPFNAETPVAVLQEYDVTPTHLHFKRHHLPVPAIQDAAYELELLGDLEERTFTLDDIKALPKHSVTMTLQCSGNRRTEMVAAQREGLPPVRGLPWQGGAISTATWSGAKLRDVLLAAGLKEDDPKGPKHITFVGLDVDITGERYEASIPIQKAISAYGDVILAYEMNGEPLPRDHGYPLRAVVPGTTAARSVKWVYKIVASEDECDGFWQQNDYRAFTPSQDPNTVDWSSAPSMQEYPVTSFMTAPEDGQVIAADQKELQIQGIAAAGGGRSIARVDVSVDGGHTWQVAKLAPDSQEGGRAWAWRKFSANVALPEGRAGGEIEVVCKAVDEAYNSQPDRMDAIYNFRGIVVNGWQRLRVRVGES